MPSFWILVWIWLIILKLFIFHSILFLEIGMEGTQDIDQIPDAVQKPLFTAVKNLEPHYVILDLETFLIFKFICYNC
jgi:hypothetical protein